MRPEGIKTGRKVSWPVLVALFLVPLLVAGTLLGLVGNDSDDKITAAIVNLDDGTEIDGQFVPMGRQLAAKMMEREGQNIRWILADKENADKGLLNGDYAAVITIPSNFSTAATSFSANDADKAQRARIGVDVSRNAPAGDAGLAVDIARIATHSLNEMLTSQYLNGIYLGFNQVGDQFGQIVDGARQLEGGSSELADGMGEAAKGSSELADGMRELSANSGKLTSGGDELSSGSYDLAGGAAQLADGAAELNSGVQQMARQMPALVAGVGQLAAGAEQLLPGVAQYAEGVAQAIGGVGQIRGGLDQVVEGMDSAQMDFSQLDQLVSGSAELADGAGQVADGLDQVVEKLAPLDGLISDELIEAAEQLQGRAGELGRFLRETDDVLRGYASGETPLPQEVVALAEQLKASYECPVEDEELCEQLREAYAQAIDDALTKGFREGAGKASEFLHSTEPQSGRTYLELAEWAGHELANTTGPIIEGMRGLQQFVPGMTQLRDGARAVADGNQQLADGIKQLTTELPAAITSELGKLRDGIAQIRDGAAELEQQAQPLVTGGSQLADGSRQLLGGIRELNSQVGAIPGGVNQLADGTSRLSSGARELSDGLNLFSGGVLAYVDGVWQYTDGVGQAANGVVALDEGLGKLSDGTRELADGAGTFAGELAEGQKQIPHYSEADREALASVVSSPVDGDDQPIAKGNVPLSALILAAGVWLAALAAFVVARPVPSDVVTSSRTSAALWARTVGLPTAIVVGVGAVLGVVGGVLLSLSVGRTIGLMAILMVLGVAFSLTHHALAGWLGHIGRGVSLVLLAVTVALGLSSAVPGWLDVVAAISPAHSGMLLTRAWLAGAQVVTSIGVMLFVGALMAALSWMAIAMRRQLSPSKFRLRQA